MVSLTKSFGMHVCKLCTKGIIDILKRTYKNHNQVIVCGTCRHTACFDRNSMEKESNMN